MPAGFTQKTADGETAAIPPASADRYHVPIIRMHFPEQTNRSTSGARTFGGSKIGYCMVKELLVRNMQLI